jgi:hypothetical protein
MNLADFRDLLDRHGPDLREWPEGEHAAAQAFLGRSPEARAELSQAERLEQMLSMPLPATERLHAAVLAIPSAHVQVRPAVAPTKRASRWMFWTPAMAMAASLMLGFFVGTADLAPDDDDDDALIAVASLLYGPEQGIFLP